MCIPDELGQFSGREGVILQLHVLRNADLCAPTMYRYIYVRYGYTTRPVLKLSGLQRGPHGLKSGSSPTVLKLARRLANSLQYQLTASKPSGWLYNFLKTVLTASKIYCAGDRGVGTALLIASIVRFCWSTPLSSCRKALL